MNKQRIGELLSRLSVIEDPRELASIMIEFGESTAHFELGGELDTPAEGIETFMDHLITELWVLDKSQFLVMYPVFQIICGDRDDNSLLADL